MRPAWYETMICQIKQVLPPIVTTVIGAVKTGASMYQAMSITLACFAQLWDCVPIHVARVAVHISHILPSDIHPLANSVLLQILAAALYSALLDKSEKCVQKQVTILTEDGVKKPTDGHTNKKTKSQAQVPEPSTSKTVAPEIKNSTTSFDGTNSSLDAIALALAESLCSIDEDNKHTEQIEEFLDYANENLRENDTQNDGCKRVEFSQQMVEILASDLLMTTEGKKGLKVFWHIKFILTVNYIINKEM